MAQMLHWPCLGVLLASTHIRLTAPASHVPLASMTSGSAVARPLSGCATFKHDFSTLPLPAHATGHRNTMLTCCVISH